MPVVRVLAYLLRKVFRMFYPFGISVKEHELAALRRVAARGPIVLLPTHKSYMDFLILSYLCFKHQLPLPHIFSGDNLNITVVGRILRWSGAFFVRRSFIRDSSPIYRVIFEEYMHTLLSRGLTIAAFIEGGRSRSGKLMPPKPGFLRVVMDSVIDGHVEDCFVAPVTLTYDRIPESESLVYELTGGVKTPERLASALASTLGVIRDAARGRLSFGHVTVGFAEPFSMQQYFAGVKVPAAFGQVNQGFGRFDASTSNELRKYLSSALAYRSMYECNRTTTVAPAALVSTVLLTHPGRGIRVASLIDRVRWLSAEVAARGGRVQRGDDSTITATIHSVLDRVLESKKKTQLIKRHKGILITSLYSPTERMELSVLRNSLIHYFVSEAVLCCAIYACEINESGWELTSAPGAIDVKSITPDVEFITRLLKFEFIYKPSPALDTSFRETVEFMKERGVLDTGEEGTVCVRSEGTDTYLFLCSLIWPFLDSYWIVILSFFYLLPNKLVDEAKLLAWQQAIGERLYFESQLDMYEAVSKETLQNAISLYESWNVVRFVDVETAAPAAVGKRIVELREAYRTEESLQELTLRIGRLRKCARAYRSRRFIGSGLKSFDPQQEAITLVKNIQGDATNSTPNRR